MSLLFLETDDFEVKQSPNGGTVLCNKLPNYSLILFYSTKCEICKTLLPIYKKLPRMVVGCQFGIVNVSNCKDLVQMSKTTKTVLEYVPYIVIYINGRPFMSYEGRHNENDIAKFVQDVYNDETKRQKNFVAEKNKHITTDIPSYTIGVPVKGDTKSQICYITWLDYVKK